MLKKLIYPCSLILLIFVPACRESPTSTDDTPAGRRDYTWTVDTLRDEPGAAIWLSELWGSSPNDVWSVGNGNASDHCKWHFDGTKWEKDSIRLSSNLLSVFGFAQNDVWACEGPGGRIFHYDGTIWKLFGDYEPADSLLGLRSIYGDAPNNIYCVGSMYSRSGVYRGIMMHYDGNNWDFVPIPFIETKFNWIRKDYLTGLYFIWGTKGISGIDTTEIYKYDGNKIECVYSDVKPIIFGQVGNTLIFNDGTSFYSYFHGKFNPWMNVSDVGLSGGLVWGRSNRDIFTGRKGNIKELMHYNGDDWASLIQLPSTSIWSLILFSNDIFILSHDLTTPIIYHGKLN